ncbi:hypothetical protein L596_014421 [Steinernema carpocapsae]|uniref:Apple domain-containing protein n=1 Tax=Steinernema carpocapsae TaxID=34508 RepID=A0A4U5NCG0_STECR|nr:hypothetical protein L596_014421 [Steinernema carpocapsae]
MFPRSVGLLVAFLIAVADAVPGQCNLGLKLFSIEGGKALCAPLVPFKCIEACEWNSTCAKTAHWNTFGKGRRSFVSGMLLTDSAFYVQCCASMATIVDRNDAGESTCVWTRPTEVVVDHGSIRTEPVLRSNEYIRDITVERMSGTTIGYVQMRLEICKFRLQRDHCNKELMEPNDRRLYDLQLLRLSRATLLNRGISPSVSTSTSTSSTTTSTIPPIVLHEGGHDEPHQSSVVVDSDVNDEINSSNVVDLPHRQRENPIVKVVGDNTITAPIGEERCRRRAKRALKTATGAQETCHREFKQCCEVKVGTTCSEICSLRVDRSTVGGYNNILDPGAIRGLNIYNLGTSSGITRRKRRCASPSSVFRVLRGVVGVSRPARASFGPRASPELR